MKPRTVVARVEGAVYRLPEMWLVGASQRGLSVREALQSWHEQEQMARRFEVQP